MPEYVSDDEKIALRKRFGVQNGQMRSPYTFKNLWLRFCNEEGAGWDVWVNVDSFNYGDVDQEDLLRFMSELQAGEMIVGLWESWDYEPGTHRRAYDKIPDIQRDVAVTVTKDRIWAPTRSHINLES